DAALWPRLLDRQLEHLSPGTHLCRMYTSPPDRLRVLSAFFGGGLMHGEQCVYFADPVAAADVGRVLHALDLPAHAPIDHGGMVMVTTRSQFVRNGHFQPQAMFQLQDAMTRQARSGGFSALRIACEMNWVLGGDISTQRFVEYEAMLTSTIGASDRSIVCQYDQRQLQSPVIR